MPHHKLRLRERLPPSVGFWVTSPHLPCPHAPPPTPPTLLLTPPYLVTTIFFTPLPLPAHSHPPNTPTQLSQDPLGGIATRASLLVWIEQRVRLDNNIVATLRTEPFRSGRATTFFLLPNNNNTLYAVQFHA